jgi:L-asparaginase
MKNKQMEMEFVELVKTVLVLGALVVGLSILPLATAKALPKVVIIPTGGTIQNSQPFVTSSKAGGPLNVLRPQNLYEPVTVKIAKEDIDGNPLPLAPGEEPFWLVTLSPEDGLYLLPYMKPGHTPPKGYTGARIGVPRLIKEINKFGLHTTGRNNLIASLADIVVKQIIDPRTGKELRVGGDTFTMYELVLVANAVNSALEEKDVVGCIVTQGTFTAEETAGFLNYAVNSDKPVIVSASQRRHTEIGNDGDNNLLDAVRVAIHPEARGKGVMMVMNATILPSREVTKSNQRPDGFLSSGGSARALGTIEEDQVTFYFEPVRKHTFKSEVRVKGLLPTMLPRVDIVKTYAGADGVPIEALIDRALKEREADKTPKKHGIVVEGFAYTGGPSGFQLAALEKAVAKYGIPVAHATRGDYGRAPAIKDTGEKDLFIRCDNMMAVKARLLLTLAIEKFGMLTPYKKFESPTAEEKERLEREIEQYQNIFNTH